MAGRGARHSQRLAFGGNLADQTNLLRLHHIEAAPGEQQIAHYRIAQIPLQPWNPAESRNQPKPQFGKTESRHAVGNHNVANQRQFEPSAKGHPVHRRDRRQRRRIEHVHHRVDTLQELPYSAQGRIFFHLLPAPKQLAQIRARRKPGLQRRMNNQRVRIIRQQGQGRRKFLQLLQRKRPDLVTRVAMKRQLNRSIHDLPRKRLSFEVLHTVVAAAGFFADSYIASISFRNRSAIRSRFSFPFAVSSPLSMVNACSTR